MKPSPRRRDSVCNTLSARQLNPILRSASLLNITSSWEERHRCTVFLIVAFQPPFHSAPASFRSANHSPRQKCRDSTKIANTCILILVMSQNEKTSLFFRSTSRLSREGRCLPSQNGKYSVFFHSVTEGGSLFAVSGCYLWSDARNARPQSLFNAGKSRRTGLFLLLRSDSLHLRT